jgi:hypothetical protein
MRFSCAEKDRVLSPVARTGTVHDNLAIANIANYLIYLIKTVIYGSSATLR